MLKDFNVSEDYFSNTTNIEKNGVATPYKTLLTNWHTLIFWVYFPVWHPKGRTEAVLCRNVGKLHLPLRGTPEFSYMGWETRISWPAEALQLHPREGTVTLTQTRAMSKAYPCCSTRANKTSASATVLGLAGMEFAFFLVPLRCCGLDLWIKPW